MNRRSFISLVLVSPLSRMIPTRNIPAITWNDVVRSEVPQFSSIYKPHPAQLEFFNRNEDDIIYGIPYHQFNVTSGSWLGIKRK